jgi:hypothetical protein
LSIGRDGSSSNSEGGATTLLLRADAEVHFLRAGPSARPDPKPISSTDAAFAARHTLAMWLLRLSYRTTCRGPHEYGGDGVLRQDGCRHCRRCWQTSRTQRRRSNTLHCLTLQGMSIEARQWAESSATEATSCLGGTVTVAAKSWLLPMHLQHRRHSRAERQPWRAPQSCRRMHLPCSTECRNPTKTCDCCLKLRRAAAVDADDGGRRAAGGKARGRDRASHVKNRNVTIDAQPRWE